MKFLRHLLGITKLDKEKNQCVRGKKTRAQNIRVVEETKQYHKKWLQHVQRMDTNRISKQAVQYRPKGRRNLRRPKKRWRNQLHFEDQGTGNTPNHSGTWWWWWFSSHCAVNTPQLLKFIIQCYIAALSEIRKIAECWTFWFHPYRPQWLTELPLQFWPGLFSRVRAAWAWRWPPTPM